MSAENDPKKRLKREKLIKEAEANVLYQKIGSNWYAYSIVDDEVYMGTLTEEDVERLRAENQLDVKKSA